MEEDEGRREMWTCVCVSYLPDVDPVAYDASCGSRLSLCPLQVIGVVVPLQDPNRVGGVEVKLCIIRLCCIGKGLVRDSVCEVAYL